MDVLSDKSLSGLIGWAVTVHTPDVCIHVTCTYPGEVYVHRRGVGDALLSFWSCLEVNRDRRRRRRSLPEYRVCVSSTVGVLFPSRQTLGLAYVLGDRIPFLHHVNGLLIWRCRHLSFLRKPTREENSLFERVLERKLLYEGSRFDSLRHCVRTLQEPAGMNFAKLGLFFLRWLSRVSG